VGVAVDVHITNKTLQQHITNTSNILH